jgi:Ca-activated chloride channel family protein
MTRWSCLPLVAGLVLALFASPHQARAQSTDAILILDASGSMWGAVDGQTKISAARRAVDSILAKWKPGDRLGLMAYGHRVKGDCRDIELIVPPQGFDGSRIQQSVRALNPKGKTPIADSLRAAAQALQSNERKATVILVSDGIETCSPDPCAVAAELRKAGVGFTAHVIGFDVTDPIAKEQLQCIARATSGVYLDARNAAGLEQALGRAVDATQGAQVKTEAPAKPAADPFKGKNIRGLARLAEGLDPISDNRVGWLMHRPAGGEKGEYVDRFDGSPFAGAIAPGDYVVAVEYGQLSRNFPVKVERGKQAVVDVVLDAGYVTSDGTVAGAGKAEGVAWEVFTAKDEWIATDYEPVPRFVLPAGDYVLRLTKGSSKTEKAFNLAAGDSINVSLELDVGKLVVSAVYASGGPKVGDGIAVEVTHPAKMGGEKGEWVATTYDAVSQFDLPGGAYDVTVSIGAASRTVRADVKSGTPTQLNVDLQAGVAGIDAPGAYAIEVFEAERDINNQRKLVFNAYDQKQNLALNAGRYVLFVEYDGGRKKEQPFTVTAGQRTDVQVTK